MTRTISRMLNRKRMKDDYALTDRHWRTSWNKSCSVDAALLWSTDL